MTEHVCMLGYLSLNNTVGTMMMFCRTSRQLKLKCPLPFGTFLQFKHPLSTVSDLVDISPKFPPNLILAEEKVLKPKPAPIIPPEDYLFPILNVPEV